MALVICVNRKALNTHIWKEKKDYVVQSSFVITLFREVCICHACYKQALTQLFSHVGRQKQALPKAICSVDTCDETVYRNTNRASREQIENLAVKKLVTFAI